MSKIKNNIQKYFRKFCKLIALNFDNSKNLKLILYRGQALCLSKHHTIFLPKHIKQLVFVELCRTIFVDKQQKSFYYNINLNQKRRNHARTTN